MMEIKEILLNGGSVSMHYKKSRYDWMSYVKIYGLEGGLGLQPKIIIESPVFSRAEYSWNEIDAAVKFYESIVLNKRNLCYKMTQAMLQLHAQGFTSLDLEDPSHLEMVEMTRLGMIREEEI